MSPPMTASSTSAGYGASYEQTSRHQVCTPGASEDADHKFSPRQDLQDSYYPPQRNAPMAGKIAFSHAPPVVLGISLVSVNALPDRFRGIFQFPLFNAVQSKCFHSVYGSNDNIVLSSPTGSGKTAILELAICALANELSQGNYKVIYQAPTKALCAERKRGTAPHQSSYIIRFSFFQILTNSDARLGAQVCNTGSCLYRIDR